MGAFGAGLKVVGWKSSVAVDPTLNGVLHANVHAGVAERRPVKLWLGDIEDIQLVGWGEDSAVRDFPRARRWLLQY